MTLLLVLLFLFNQLSFNDSPYKCKSAKSAEVPQGYSYRTNSLYSYVTVKKIRGQVRFTDNSPAEFSIIEVFDFKQSDEGKDIYKIPNDRKRRLACFSENGRFNFNLPPGVYLLRAGLNYKSPMDLTYLKVRLAPQEKVSVKNIKMILELGD